MKAEDIKKVCVIGGGQMGRQIALNSAKYGYNTYITDSSAEVMDDMRKWVNEYLRGRVEKGKMTEKDSQVIFDHFHIVSTLEEAAKDSDLVIEAIIEDKKVKEDLFKRLDAIVGKDCIITSNSSFMVSSTFKDCVRNPSRLANLHYFNPALVMELVEVVKGEHTSQETADILLEFCNKTGKKPVLIAKEIDGFIANRIMMAISEVALSLFEHGYASPEDIDTAAVKGLGHAMGPFALMDLSGLDVSYLVKKRAYEETGIKPAGLDALQLKVEAGELGVKSGKGWYTYPKRKND